MTNKALPDVSVDIGPKLLDDIVEPLGPLLVGEVDPAGQLVHQHSAHYHHHQYTFKQKNRTPVFSVRFLIHQLKICGISVFLSADIFILSMKTLRYLNFKI